MVRRAVQISSKVGFFQNGPQIRLEDLMRARSTRRYHRHSNFNIYVGNCSWSILAPQEK